MDDKFGLIIGLLVGLFAMIRYRQLAKMANKGSSGPIPKEWMVFITRAGFLILGFIFFIVSLIKLIALL